MASEIHRRAFEENNETHSGIKFQITSLEEKL